MQTGLCELCRQTGKLHESHFIPRALYKLLRHSNNGNDNPVLISKKISTQKSFQMKQPLLCSACERRFSVNGENYVLPLLSKRDRFPLYERLKLALPMYTTPDKMAFRCPAVGIDGEKLGYFALSLLWRAAVRSWRMPDGGTTFVQVDAVSLESLRAYLAGESAFPHDVAILATVATDFLSQQLCFVPCRVTENPHPIVYSLITAGVAFRIVTGTNDPTLRAISCAGPGLNMIYLRDCSDNSWEIAAEMMETSIPTGQLAAQQ
jgi:hypothetical protein